MNTVDWQQQIHSHPRMAMNAMVRYLVATAGQRATILKEQKYPSTYRTTWYETACEALTRFIVGGMTDQSHITDAIAKLKSITPGNDAEETKINVNIEALEEFLGSFDALDLCGLTPSRVTTSTPKLEISGVSISVMPDIQLSGLYRGKDVVGSIKLYFSKLHPATEEMASYGATLVMHHQEVLLSPGLVVRKGSCLFIDVFTGLFRPAPDASTKRMKDIAAACTEIAQRWLHI